jgi:thiol:disulfide interchange protein DsbA
MQRREFSIATASVATAASLGALSTPAQAQAPAPRAGTDYLVLDKPAPVDAPAGKIEVVPVSFRPDFEPQQRLYYVLEAMNKVEELHKKVFLAIHGEKQMLNTPELVAAWAEKQGLNRAKFTEMYNSFSIATKARKATQLQDAYKVAGVPALGVAGRFYTSGELAKNMDHALQVTDYLVVQARKG